MMRVHCKACGELSDFRRQHVEGRDGDAAWLVLAWCLRCNAHADRARYWYPRALFPALYSLPIHRSEHEQTGKQTDLFGGDK